MAVIRFYLRLNLYTGRISRLKQICGIYIRIVGLKLNRCVDKMLYEYGILYVTVMISIDMRRKCYGKVYG